MHEENEKGMQSCRENINWTCKKSQTYARNYTLSLLY